MRDDVFDHLLDRAKAGLRPPPEAPLAEIWAAVERGRAGSRTGRGGLARRWWMTVGVAAGLLVAFSLGRWTAPPTAPAPDAVVAAGERPIDETTTLLLGESAVLLMALPAEGTGNAGSSPLGEARFAAQARDLLVTTRLLLDARGSSNPRLHDLLQDLELTLAQIARLQSAPTRDELKLIVDAMEQQEIVPRIQRLAAGLNAGDD
jgi:hypothetical protein